MREQKLRNVELMFREHRGIKVHQLRLTDGGACLEGRQVQWTFLQPDNTHSGCDRTAGDDDALASVTNESRQIGTETAKLFVIECVGARPGENAGAELEENAPGFSGHAELLSKSENESAQKQFSQMMAAFPSEPRTEQFSVSDCLGGLNTGGH